jgi:hypothetical protein
MERSHTVNLTLSRSLERNLRPEQGNTAKYPLGDRCAFT